LLGFSSIALIVLIIIAHIFIGVIMAYESILDMYKAIKNYCSVKKEVKQAN
jgi:hypothetical protein